MLAVPAQRKADKVLAASKRQRGHPPLHLWRLTRDWSATPGEPVLWQRFWVAERPVDGAGHPPRGVNRLTSPSGRLMTVTACGSSPPRPKRWARWCFSDGGVVELLSRAWPPSPQCPLSAPPRRRSRCPASHRRHGRLDDLTGPRLSSPSSVTTAPTSSMSPLGSPRSVATSPTRALRWSPLQQ